MSAAAPATAHQHSAKTIGEIKRQFRQDREALITAFRQNLRPDGLLHGLRRVVDQIILELLEHHPLPPGYALAAVGGYGRGELYPFSDVDILILLPDNDSEGTENAVSALITALWDIGLEPGHSVRTIAECLSEAQADITVETALLEARWLAGSRTQLRKFTQQLQQQLDPKAFFKAKLLEMQRRHLRYESTPFALEPNCKESPGGLRDLQVILWMARAAGYGRTWRQVGDAGLLNADEARQLRRSEQTFKRLRIELHLQAKRREDRLLFDLQPALASTYRFSVAETRRPSELLMQHYYRAAKLVTQLNTILVQNIEERLFGLSDIPAEPIDDDFLNRRGLLDVYRDDAFERKPTMLLRAFLVMQQHTDLRGMSVRVLRGIWQARSRIDAQFRANPVHQKLFLTILQQPRGIVHELRRMNDLSILPRYLPAFRRIVGQMQHDLFHVYTVDQHILMVVRNLRRFTMAEHAHEYPLCSDLIANFDRHWLLYVAALFHDIAKGRGGDHSTLGAQEVRRFSRQHGLSSDDSELVEFLVREHLQMSTVAQKQDLSDPEVIQAFAARMRDQRHLTALYLLTVADIRGTSPKVWNGWKGKLLEDLYRQTRAVLGGEVIDATTVLDQRKKDAIQLLRLAGLRDEARDALWQRLDVAYFLRHEATDIAWHTRHLYHRVSSPDPVVRARLTDSVDSLQFVIYAPQSPDLFVRLCAWFDSQRLSIQDARIHTTLHGWALDSFIVLAPEPSEEPRARLAVLEHELAAWLRGTSTTSHTTTPCYSRASRRSRTFPITPSIKLYPDDKGSTWVLDLVAADRPGLLHALSRVFAAHDVTLHTAKIMTLGERVEDTFVISGQAMGSGRQQLSFEEDLITAMKG